MDYNFVEVMRNFNRMCDKYDYMCDENECPIARLIDVWEKEHNETWDRDCVFWGMKNPEVFAREVMRWTKVNPPDIYPRVDEIIGKIRQLMNVDESECEFEDFLDMRLNEAAADYFGIEPINKDKLV